MKEQSGKHFLLNNMEKPLTEICVLGKKYCSQHINIFILLFWNKKKITTVPLESQVKANIVSEFNTILIYKNSAQSPTYPIAIINIKRNTLKKVIKLNMFSYILPNLVALTINYIKFRQTETGEK